jgi:hypothetical protein
MPNAEDIRWFKQQFGTKIDAAIAGTPFDLDMLAAFACQETGEIWPVLRRAGLPVDQILKLCVGDTLDRKKTFPRDRANLESRAGGKEMFESAHAALVAMARYIPGYAGAARNPNKFCKGFGIFQYDMQFFGPDTAAYFLGGYADFDICLKRCVGELKSAMARAKVKPNPTLTDMQKAAVAIAYNSGGYDPKKGLNQGFQPKGGQFYGQAYYAYLLQAQKVRVDALPVSAPQPGEAILPDPGEPQTGKPFIVATETGLLNVRRTPAKGNNVDYGLPRGHPVMVMPDAPRNGFVRIETNLRGALVRGWVWAAFLSPAAKVVVEAELALQGTPPAAIDVPAVYLPLRAGTIIRRSEPANAGSLNEAGQPKRGGTTPDQLRTEIASIIDWLAVDKLAHKRYQPRSGITFCNIYAHDFCYLANVYLPRMWWGQAALTQIARGVQVEPRYGDTIDEQRANDLFRWLRDFGPQFGWRQTGSLTKLQLAANSGGIGTIVARRKEDGKSGHIVMVVPEISKSAVWDSKGEVTSPLQSQAGVTNFRYGTGRPDWWRGDQFAEFAFWIHA